jgi:hypothetical protein
LRILSFSFSPAVVAAAFGVVCRSASPLACRFGDAP